MSTFTERWFKLRSALMERLDPHGQAILRDLEGEFRNVVVDRNKHIARLMDLAGVTDLSTYERTEASQEAAGAVDAPCPYNK